MCKEVLLAKLHELQHKLPPLHVRALLNSHASSSDEGARIAQPSVATLLRVSMQCAALTSGSRRLSFPRSLSIGASVFPTMGYLRDGQWSNLLVYMPHAHL